jgi:hypothetical protein
MRKNWWEYIYIRLVAVVSEENVHDGRKGSQTVRTGTKYSLGEIEWQRRRVAVFLQESYGCSLGGKNVHYGRKGSQSLGTGTKQSLGGIG